MGQYHTVVQGEHLARIARRYGFPDAAVVWSHENNAALRQLRATPDVLKPGDHVYIPDGPPKEARRATEQRHRFRVRVRRPRLRLALESLLGQPLRSARCELRVGDQVYTLSTDGHGLIEQDIPVDAERADLTIHAARTPLQNRVIPLFIGHLDPVDTTAGQEARLNNLGYRAGNAGDPTAYDFRSAVEEFQCDYGLAVDGKCGPVTQRKLVAVHGS